MRSERVQWFRVGGAMTRSISIRRGTLTAALFVIAGCDEPGGIACTASFAIYTIVVTDRSGAPVDGVDLAVTLVRTGEQLEPTAVGGPYPVGTYPLVDDAATTKLRPMGDEVRAVATKGTASVQADFVFAVPGGCHVHKVSGPDTVALP